MRTHYNSNILEDKINETVTLVGWINSIRDHGGVYFIDLRDVSGLIQIVANPKSLTEETYKKFHTLRNEWVIQVSGLVRARGAGLENPNLLTGKIELVADDVNVLSKAKTLPFDPTDKNVGIDIRNKYRYLELRNPANLHTFISRNKISNAIRQVLINQNFIDVETPILTKSTPEGARDYLVPSRTQPGSFFALPQSPQLFKQMLMVAGFEKYMQMAHCFRDEDLRADRQPQFLQLDVEMSFVGEEEVKSVANEVLTVAMETMEINIDEINKESEKTLDWLNSIGCKTIMQKVD